MKQHSVKNIGFFVFDGVQALDLLGPLDAFQEANSVGKHPAYNCVIVSQDGQSVTTSSNVGIKAHCSLLDHPPLHTLIVPGGFGARQTSFDQTTLSWVSHQCQNVKRFGSICTGLFILAQTGLLDGETVVTHWAHVDEAKEKFSKLNIEADSLFIRNKRLFTAAGVTSGIDLALSLIEEDLGPSVSAAVAKHLVVFLKRPGDQRQFSSVLQSQLKNHDQFGDLIPWIADHLNEPITSFVLAERVGLSERQFRRRFAHAFGETPTRFIENLRIEAACSPLTQTQIPIKQIASTVGLSNPNTFRRVFERIKGITPSEYRQRFGHTELLT